MESPPPFLEILVSTHRTIRAYLAGMGVPIADVDDIAQDVYFAYYKDQARRPPDVAPLAWLRGIARRRALDHFRSRGRQLLHWEKIGERIEATSGGAASSTLDQAGAEESLLGALSDCVGRLSEKQRELLQWYYSDALSAEEIGKRTGRSAPAVRMLMLRLRDGLRDCVLGRLAQGEAR